MCACIKAFPGNWGWDQLGLKYTSNPRFQLDEMVISEPGLTDSLPVYFPDSLEDVSDCFDKDEITKVSFKPLQSRSGKSTLRLKCRNMLKENYQPDFPDQGKNVSRMPGRGSFSSSNKGKNLYP